VTPKAKIKSAYAPKIAFEDRLMPKPVVNLRNFDNAKMVTMPTLAGEEGTLSVRRLVYREKGPK
jgi:hypothetical protein